MSAPGPDHGERCEPGRVQVWLPRSGVMITCCPAHEARTGPRRTHTEVRAMVECPDCAKEKRWRTPLEEESDA